MSVLAGFFISDIEKRKSLAIDEATAEMTREVVFNSAANSTKWQDGGLTVIQYYHGGDGIRHCPALNADGSLALFFDGEIFNHDTAKRYGNRHAVIRPGLNSGEAGYCLDVYQKNGIRGLESLNGSFVIVVYDRQNQEVIIANDRFGSRPLYYHVDSRGIVFGTQLGPLLRFPGIGKELDFQAVFEFFTYQRVLETRTFLKDVKLLPPSTALRFRGGRPELSAYWRMEYRPDYAISKKKYSIDLAGAVYDAVKARLRGDHRIGLLLSGGLDSRIILAASQDIVKLETITIADYYNREVRVAEKIARAAGCRHHFIPRPRDHYAHLVDDAVRIGGGMFRFDHAHYIGLFDSMGERCDVLLHGFDPEVLFRASNMPRKVYDLPGVKITSRSLKTLSEDSLVDEILNNVKYSMWGADPKRLFREQYSQLFDSTIRDSTSRVINDLPADVSPHNRFDWFVVHNRFRYPSALFVLSIRPYMVERSVVSDNNLLDLYLNTPPEIRADPSIWAHAIAYLSRDIARIEDANTGLPPLPPYSWTISEKSYRFIRKRMKGKSPQTREAWFSDGSWPDFQELIRRNESLRGLISATITDADCLDPTIFDTARVGELADLHFSGKENHVPELFLLVTFGRWYRRYLAGA